jgi:hypothetical protein
MNWSTSCSITSFRRPESGGRVGGWLLSVALLLQGCGAPEENAGPGSPLYAVAVQSALEEQNKAEAGGDDRVAAQPVAHAAATPKDLALLEFVRTETAGPAAASVFVYWSEQAGAFLRAPPRASDAKPAPGDFFVFWSDADKQFMQVPMERSEALQKRTPPGRGLVLSRAEVVHYAYWCDRCKACHQQRWRLRESPDQVPVEVLKTESAGAH